MDRRGDEAIAVGEPPEEVMSSFPLYVGLATVVPPHDLRDGRGEEDGEY